MKKITLTAISIIVFQLLVFSQTEFGLTGGFSANWVRHNISFIQSPLTPGVKLGLFLRHNIIKDAFTLEAGLDYSYLVSTGTYTVNFYNVSPGDSFFDAPIWVCDYLNNDIYNLDFHQLSIPISFQFNSKFVQPYCGMEFFFKQTSTYYDKFTDDPTVTDMYGIGVLTGLRIELTRQSNLNLGYFHGFTEDRNAQINDGEWYLKNSHVEATFQYTFKNRNKDKKV